MLYCDPETGVCEINTSRTKPSENAETLNNTLIYFGDPMCSWCWGIAPEIDELLDDIGDEYNFKLVMGGLRPGGGDPWNDEMKNYLREHWQHVIEKSGQPFSFDLFERNEFDYNTEPPCRAVKTAQSFDESLGLPFYHSVQHHFYAKNNDPGDVSFYEPVCDEFEINFQEFEKRFRSEEIRKRTRQDFSFTQHLGVRGFPSLILVLDNQPYYIARGYSTRERMNKRIEHAKKQVIVEPKK